MPIDRGPFNALVDDDGSNTVGTVWDKTQIKTVILDPVDAAITASGGATLPINLTTQVTGTLQAAQEPAHTGDVTNAAGSLALVIGNTAVTKAKLAIDIPLSTFLPGGGVILTDGASVALNASLRAAYYRLVAAGDRTITAPTGIGSSDGQKLIIQHVASGAARTLTLTTGAFGFRFGTDIPALTQTASGKTDYIGCIFNVTDSRWDVVAYTKGF